MIRYGVHAATIEKDGRGFSHVWSGLTPPAPAAGFVDQSWHAPYSGLGLRIAGAHGAVIRPGFKGYRAVDFDATIYGAVIVADTVGSIDFEIYRTAYADLPHRQTDSIVGLAAMRPKLVNQQVNADLALFSWSTTLMRGDLLGIEVISAAKVSSVTLTLLVNRNNTFFG